MTTLSVEKLHYLGPEGSLQAEAIERHVIDGVAVVRVSIHDRYEPQDDSERDRQRHIQAAISGFETELRSGDETRVQDAITQGKAWLERSPTIKSWKGIMKSAMALYPLQRPETETLLDGTLIDGAARELFLYGQDAKYIRSRGGIFAWLLNQRDGKVKKVVSLGGGAAVPETDAIAKMHEKPHLTVVDMSHEALDHVSQVIEQAGIGAVSIETVQLDLIREFTLAKKQPEKLPKGAFEVVDGLGITEYFKGRILDMFLGKAYELVKPGGVMIFGNMLPNSTLQFNKKIVEWPDVNERTVEDLVGIVKKVAGQAAKATIYIPEDGGYAVVEIEKPLDDHASRALGSSALAPH